MKLFKIVVFLLLANSIFLRVSFAQDYRLYNYYIQHSRILTLEGGSDSLCSFNQIAYYDSAFNCVNGNGFIEHYIRALALSIRNNDLDKAKEYYLEALKKGATKWYVKNDLCERDFDILRETDQYKDANKYYRANKNEWKVRKNKKLCKKIRKIMYRDEIPRRFKNWEKVRENDSINVVTLTQIYCDNGRLPNVNDVGKVYSLKLQVPFLHFHPEDVCFFANILLEMYLKGDYDDLDFIFLIIDQTSERYGANFGFEDNKFFIKETIPNSINERGYHKQSFGFNAFDIKDSSGYWYKYYLPVHDKDYANEIRQYFGYVKLEDMSKSNKYHIYDEQVFIEKWGEFKERVE